MDHIFQDFGKLKLCMFCFKPLKSKKPIFLMFFFSGQDCIVLSRVDFINDSPVEKIGFDGLSLTSRKNSSDILQDGPRHQL